MRDYPQHTLATKEETSGDLINRIITEHESMSPERLRVNLEILISLTKREQMIEDHKLYMGAIKEASNE